MRMKNMRDHGKTIDAQALFIATTVNGREYVVVLGNQVVAGPFATAAEAVKRAGALPEANSVSEVLE
jgi:hypothetical protein